MHVFQKLNKIEIFAFILLHFEVLHLIKLNSVRRLAYNTPQISFLSSLCIQDALMNILS